MSTKLQMTASELYNDDFIQKYSKFHSLDEILEKEGYCQDDLYNLTDDQKDNIIDTHTEFSNWQEMKSAAIRSLMQPHIRGCLD